MKKSKRSNQWEDQELDASGDLEFELGDSEEEDEIIELEDIIELPPEESQTERLGEKISLHNEDADLGDLNVEFDAPVGRVMEDDLEAPLELDDQLDEEMPGKPAALAAENEITEDSAAESKALLDEPRIEEFVSQIEEKLIEAVGQIVEAKLPGIVRDVLAEEIEKLKNELDREDS